MNISYTIMSLYGNIVVFLYRKYQIIEDYSFMWQ